MGTTLIAELERIGRDAKRAQLIADLEQIGAAVPTPKNKPSKFSPEYLEYLNSPHWQARRERLSLNKRCGGCNTTVNLQLHHRCYPAKGAPLQAFIDQSDDEFTWLCEPCHKAITQSMRKRHKPKTSKQKK